MLSFLRTFWIALGSVGGVIALYVGAEAANLIWTFWLAVSVAGVIAIVLRIGPLALTAVERVRAYPALLDVAAQRERRIVALEQSERAARLATETAREQGIMEGRAQVAGAALALNSTPPEIVGIAEHGGAVALVGRIPSEGLPIGARFAVRIEHTGHLRGVVEVVHSDPNYGVAYLRCVEPTVPKFWKALADRVESSVSKPEGVVLARYEGPSEMPPLDQQSSTPPFLPDDDPEINRE